MKRTFGYLLLFILTAAVVAGARLIRLQDPKAIYADEKTSIYLYKTVPVNVLATILVDSFGVAENKTQLKWAAKILGWNSFKAGHYTIEGGVTYNRFLSRLAKGGQDPISITILPGQRQQKIIADLAENFRFDSAAVYSVITDSTFLSNNNLSGKTLIGRLYPETYKFYWTQSPKKVLKRILNAFNKRVKRPYQSQLQEIDKSLDEIITLASIIEWEAANNSEKPMISGLYWNRLERGMLLQADPTVSFALGKQRRLFLEDYKVEDPYNTYIHPGLPPGPITNPDLSSIKAALFPEEHDYLYMVAQPGGGHAFSRTYAQHLRKAEEWREWLEKQYQIKESREKNNS